MALREFTDPSGRTWKVWSVYPQYADRREAERRARPHLDGKERRQREEPRVKLDASYRDGWLTFESDGDRRRLAPIPEAWESCADDALVRLCERASPIGGTRGAE